MTHEYEIEFSEPSSFHCDCCGGLSVRVTRFVYRDGDAFGAYYASYSNNHPDTELSMLISLGPWGEGAHPAQRAAFFCRVRPTEDSYEVMLGDAAESDWGHVKIMGKLLSRDEARAHPWKSTAFEVLDAAFIKDSSLRGFMKRVHCGDAAVPLETSFGAPDDIFALSDLEQAERAELQRNFACLDAKRFFVRCLVDVPVQHYGVWSIGTWIEVAKTDYERIRKVWDEPKLYQELRFTGIIANDVRADLDLPVMLGSQVQVHVPDTDTPPRIKSTPVDELSDLLTTTWGREAFERYALARGYL